jgi:hypothetical protein
MGVVSKYKLVVVSVVVVVMASVVVVVSVIVVVDMHHCSVDTTALFHAYFFYVSADRLFSIIPYHTPYKS